MSGKENKQPDQFYHKISPGKIHGYTTKFNDKRRKKKGHLSQQTFSKCYRLEAFEGYKKIPTKKI